MGQTCCGYRTKPEFLIEQKNKIDCNFELLKELF